MGDYLIAVDPGLTGAVAVLTATGHFVAVFDMPTTAAPSGKSKRIISPHLLATQLQPWAGSPAVIEQVAAMPGQGVSSMFRFGEAYGVAQGVLAALGCPISKITPTTWKRLVGIPAGSDKDAARGVAISRLPRAGDYLTRKKDSGRADALLIGLAELDRSARAAA